MIGSWDGHAHVFAPDLPFVTPRRYTPAYAATVDQFLAHLDDCGLEGGLLTQPSFLGTDNSHMLAAVARAPDRLRAVVVVDPMITERELAHLDEQGAVGIRLNLEGRDLPDLSAGPWPDLFAHLARRQWHVELHRRAADLERLIEPLLACGVRVCIDHFGRPDPELGRDDPGFRRLLLAAQTGSVWVKVSAAYRTGGVERGERIGPAMLADLLETFGPPRLIWASDWPHTQHESVVNYRSCFDMLARWGSEPGLAKRLRSEGIAALLGDRARAGQGPTILKPTAHR